MSKEPSPVAAWEHAERLAAEAEQQLFDRTLDASEPPQFPSADEIANVRALRRRASELMLAAAAARARIGKPNILRSALWLAPALLAGCAFFWLGQGGSLACLTDACAGWSLEQELTLFGAASALAAFGVAFARDHLLGGYARDLHRWEAGLPPTD